MTGDYINTVYSLPDRHKTKYRVYGAITFGTHTVGQEVLYFINVESMLTAFSPLINKLTQGKYS